MSKKRLAIFASGTGSNALNLIKYFKNNDHIEIAFILSNKEDAGIVDSAKEEGIEVIVINNSQASDAAFLIDMCNTNAIDWIILAGYLRLIPNDFVRLFDRRMVNLHPSLLPKYGGKGMHGRNVHEAVLLNKEKETGITIHFVNEKFDEGEIIAQFHCALSDDPTMNEVEGKIRLLEQSYLPVVVEKTIINAL